MAVLLGLAVAAGFGGGDFLGGRASRSASTIAVLLVSQASALVGAVVVALVVGSHLGQHDLAYGAIAGGLNVIGLGFLYQGLSTGLMGTVAPVTAIVGAVVPVTWGLVTGEQPSPLVLIGVGCAIVAGALIAREEDGRRLELGGRPLLLAVSAGAGFGMSFVFFAKTSPASGMWPVLSARAAAVVLVSVAVAWRSWRQSLSYPTGTERSVALGAGALDVGATALLLVAVRHGLVVVVAPIASLAPAATVVLAWLVLHERVSRLQLVGLAVALVGLALIAGG